MKLIFLGIQGSGKSTQAKSAAQKLEVPAIDMGQLFRDRAKEGDPEALEIRKALEIGNLVSDEVAIDTLGKRLSRSDCTNGFVLDGYPRNCAQLEGLEGDIDRVFYIKVSDQEGIARLIKRARHDDSPAVLKRRLEVYHEETKPLLVHFAKNGILKEIDGERTIEEIRQEIERRIANYAKG